MHERLPGKVKTRASSSSSQADLVQVNTDSLS
jgi:hypothetical protein